MFKDERYERECNFQIYLLNRYDLILPGRLPFKIFVSQLIDSLGLTALVFKKIELFLSNFEMCFARYFLYSNQILFY